MTIRSIEIADRWQDLTAGNLPVPIDDDLLTRRSWGRPRCRSPVLFRRKRFSKPARRLPYQRQWPPDPAVQGAVFRASYARTCRFFAVRQSSTTASPMACWMTSYPTACASCPATGHSRGRLPNRCPPALPSLAGFDSCRLWDRKCRSWTPWSAKHCFLS